MPGTESLFSGVMFFVFIKEGFMFPFFRIPLTGYILCVYIHTFSNLNQSLCLPHPHSLFSFFNISMCLSIIGISNRIISVLLIFEIPHRLPVLCKRTVTCPEPGGIIYVPQILGAPWAFSRRVRIKWVIPRGCWKVGSQLRESLLLSPLLSIHHHSCFLPNEHPK